MDNFKVDKKYAIKVEGVFETPHIYDNIQRYDKSVIGRREKDRVSIGKLITVGAKYVIEGFSLEDGRKLFSIDDVVAWTRNEKYSIIKKDNDKYYIFFDETQKIHGPFESVKQNLELILVSKCFKEKNEKKIVYGIYSSQGQLIIPIKYENIDLKKHISVITKKGKFGLLWNDGTNILEPVYDKMEFIENTNLVRVYDKAKNKYGMFSGEGQIIVPVEYDKIYCDIIGEILIVKKDQLFGIYDFDGYKNFDPIFEDFTLIPNTPLIELELKSNTLYYDVERDRFFQNDSIKLYNGNKYKYFDGKWHTVRYEKNK